VLLLYVILYPASSVGNGRFTHAVFISPFQVYGRFFRCPVTEFAIRIDPQIYADFLPLICVNLRNLWIVFDITLIPTMAIGEPMAIGERTLEAFSD
jgi:hypothetical protein